MDTKEPLDLPNFTMSEAKPDGRIEHLMNPSPSPSAASGSSPRFLDYTAVAGSPNFANQLSAALSPPHNVNSFAPLNTANSQSPVTLPPIDRIDPRAHLLNFAGDAGGSRARSLDIGGLLPATSGIGILAEASAMRSPVESKPSTGESSKLKIRSSERDRQESAPAWTEMKTKAGKDRKRLPLACIACRRKKIRCSGEKPACKHCLRGRIPCVYKVTTRKAAPRTDYMAMLDKRLKRMEDRVIKLIPKENQSAVPRAVVRPALPTPPAIKALGKKRAADEAFGNEADLSEWAKSRHLSRSGQGLGLKNSEPDEKSLLLEGAEQLPPKEIQAHLAEVYFDYIYAQSYPLLHKPSFMARLAAGNVAPVLVLAVCAISARFSNHPQLRSEPAFLRGEDWAKVAREIAMERWDTPNLTILIVYLILGLHEFGTCHGGRSWMLAGMAQRMSFALLLHQDLEHDGWGRQAGQQDTPEISPTDMEIRRRTMWSCFLMDRFNASGTDRPMQMSESFVKIPLPVNEHFFQMELSAPTENLEGKVLNATDKDVGPMADARKNMGTCAYYIKLVAIWGRTVRFWNMGGRENEEHRIWEPESRHAELLRKMENFRKTLPAHLEWSRENLQNQATAKNANQFIFLHLVYHQIRLFMNRWALPSSGLARPEKNMPKAFMLDAARAAIDASNSISHLIKEAFDHKVVAPFAGYCAFYSSTVHVQGVFSKNPRIQEIAKQNLAYNVTYLTKMKRYWGMFHFVAENLKELYRRHADAALKGLVDSKIKGEPGILQYGDWFDRYPSGVSETDFEDPASAEKPDSGVDTVLGQKSDLQSVEEFFANLSPSSKAAQLLRRKAKARKSISATKEATDQGQGPASNASADTSVPFPDLLVNFQGQPLTPGSGYGINGTGLEAAQNYNLLNNHNPLVQQPILSQLDRHFVLSSYAGVDPQSAGGLPDAYLPMSSGEPQQLGGLATLPPEFGGDFDLNGFNVNAGAQGLGGIDGATAIFLPFNMEPPELSPKAFWSGDMGVGEFGLGFDDRGLNGIVGTYVEEQEGIGGQ